MKKIFALLALCAVTVVACKFYLEYRYKKELDKALAGASIVAEVVYKDLNVGFDGAVELLGLSITPNSDFNTFSFRSIKISGFDLLFHFNGMSRIENGDFPDFVDFDINQLSFPASIYEEFATQGSQECRSLTGSVLYSSAGFDQVLANGKISFDVVDPFAATIQFSGSDQISRTSFSMNFNARQANLAALASGVIPVQSMRYDYALDEVAAKSMLQHCAKKFTITPEVFLEKVVMSDKFMMNSFSLNLGDKAKIAMTEFLKGGKELVIRSIPSERLKNLNFAGSSSPEQILRMLNLNVSLDGSSVPVNTFDHDSGEVVGDDVKTEASGYKRRNLEELLSTPDGTVQEKLKPKLIKKRKHNYENATLTRISDYIDRDVRVRRTKGRSSIKGRLLGSQDKILSVEIYRYGGVMIYTIPYADVERIEVKKR